MNDRSQFGYFVIFLTVLLIASCAGSQSPDTTVNNLPITDGDAGPENASLEDTNTAIGSPDDVEKQLADMGRGYDIWLGAGCTECHKIGDDPGGEAGPSLTGIGDRRTGEELMKLIRNPQSVNPDAVMPSQNLPDDDLDFLAEYLRMLSSDIANLR